MWLLEIIMASETIGFGDFRVNRIDSADCQIVFNAASNFWIIIEHAGKPQISYDLAGDIEQALNLGMVDRMHEAAMAALFRDILAYVEIELRKPSDQVVQLSWSIAEITGLLICVPIKQVGDF